MKTDAPILVGTHGWFCVRTQTKHEHIAAAQLKQAGIEVFLPRLRFKRPTKRGPVWFIEALFPSYLFAHLELWEDLRRFHHALGVREIVHFGDQWPTIPDAVIAELRISIGDGEMHTISEEMQPGEEVQIAGGAFNGLQAVVSRVMPGRQRVAVLLDFLGRQTSVELSSESVVRAGDERKRILLPQSIVAIDSKAPRTTSRT